MPSLAELALVAAALGAGLVAGLCFTFQAFLMRSFDRLGSPAAIRAMQSLNAEILRSSVMVVWIGTVPLGVAAAFLAEARLLPGVAAGLYAVGALAITGRGNVPLNEALDRVDPDGAEAEGEWRDYRRRWGRWNGIRTVLCAAAAVGFMLAL